MAPGIFRKLFGGTREGADEEFSSKHKVSRRSTGFNEFIRAISREDGLSVLDLGATSPANITFMTGLGHRFHQEDVLRLANDKSLTVPNGEGGTTTTRETRTGGASEGAAGARTAGLAVGVMAAIFLFSLTLNLSMKQLKMDFKSDARLHMTMLEDWLSLNISEVESLSHFLAASGSRAVVCASALAGMAEAEASEAAPTDLRKERRSSPAMSAPSNLVGMLSIVCARYLLLSLCAVIGGECESPPAARCKTRASKTILNGPRGPGGHPTMGSSYEHWKDCQ